MCLYCLLLTNQTCIIFIQIWKRNTQVYDPQSNALSITQRWWVTKWIKIQGSTQVPSTTKILHITVVQSLGQRGFDRVRKNYTDKNKMKMKECSKQSEGRHIPNRAPTICTKVWLCSGKSERSVCTEGSEIGLERQVEGRLERGSRENTDSLSYTDLPNMDTFHYTISTTSYSLISSLVSTERSLVLGMW